MLVFLRHFLSFCSCISDFRNAVGMYALTLLR